MTFLAPSWLGWAALASLGVVAIHLIAWRIPRTVLLPTARFVPDQPSRYAARALRLSDLALLALRVLILMLGGAALAEPVFSRSPSGTALVIAVERSAAMLDTSVIRSRLNALDGTGAHRAFVVFDTLSHVAASETAALGVIAAPEAPGAASLSVGLLAAIRQANRLARDYDSVHVVLVSTFTRAAFDAATSQIRDLWSDSLRLVSLAPSVTAPAAVAMTVVSDGDDPVAAGLALASANGLVAGGLVRVARVPVTAVDSALADSGATVVIWPPAARGATERVDGVVAGEFTAIGHFVPQPSSDSGRVVARWANGTPAATETTRGRGCIRTVHFDVADAGDFVLTPAFQRVASELVGPCAGRRPSGIVSDSVLRSLAAADDSVAHRAVSDQLHAPNRLAATLIILAIALAVVELLVRRRSVRVAPMPEVA